MSSPINQSAYFRNIIGRTFVINNNVNPIFEPISRFLPIEQQVLPKPGPSIATFSVKETSTIEVPSNEASSAAGFESETSDAINLNRLFLDWNIFINAPSGYNNNSADLTNFQQDSTRISNATENTKPSNIYDGSPYPIFCGSNTDYECLTTPLSSCGACDMEGAALMAALVLLLGIAIVLGNSLILMVMSQRKKKRNLENMDLHRSSLAVADLLSGLQILIIFSFNFGRSFNSTSLENHTRYFKYQDSATAAFGGMFFLLTFTSSVYNLTYLAGRRLYAVIRPIRYKMQSEASVLFGLAVAWLLAICSSTILVWFPQDFVAAYTPSTFMFFFETKALGRKSVSIALLFIFYLLPFLLTIIFLSSSALSMGFNSWKLSKHSGRNIRLPRSELQYFITVAFMQIGFTITVVPAFVIVLIDNLNPAIPYKDIARAYAICFYVAMTNSLVNVIVYSIRDPKFRTNVANIFASCCTTCCGQNVERQRVKTNRTQKSHTTPFSPSKSSKVFNRPLRKDSMKVIASATLDIV